MARALRHRYLMVYFAGFALVACAALYGLSLVRARTDVIISTMLMGLVALHVVVVTYLRVAAALLRLLRIQVTIWVTPALVIGTVAMKVILELTHSILEVPTDWSRGWETGLWVVCFLGVEGLATVIFMGPLPRALSVMRSGADRECLQASGARAEDGEELRVDETGEPIPEPLVAGTTRVPLAQIQRLEANGNYVLVVTRKGRHLVPGPYGTVAAKMPERLGRRVHRSHWVATGAALRLVKSGRDMWIETVGDVAVPVAASMQEPVERWLAERGIFLERGPKPQVAKAAR